MSADLKLFAAQHVLGELSPEDCQKTISQMADLGLVTPSTLHAISTPRPTEGDVLPAVLEALQAAGLSLPEKVDAVHVVMHHRVKSVAEFAQSRDANALWPMYRALASMPTDYSHLVPMSDKSLGDRFGLNRLIGGFWEVDYRWEHQIESGITKPGECELTESDYANILADATEWLSEHSNSGVKAVQLGLS